VTGEIEEVIAFKKKTQKIGHGPTDFIIEEKITRTKTLCGGTSSTKEDLVSALSQI